LRQGFIEVVPATTLPLLSSNVLRGLLCGADTVDLDLLKANTEYDEGISEEDQHVQWLWRTLESFNTDQRKKFLRFVWARDSLPSASVDFNQRFRVQASVPVGDNTVAELAAAAAAARAGASTSRGSRVSRVNSNDLGINTRRVSTSTDHETRSLVSAGSRGSSAGVTSSFQETPTANNLNVSFSSHLDAVNNPNGTGVNPSLISLTTAASAAREALLDIDIALARSNLQGELTRSAMLERVPPSMRSQILRATSRPGSALVPGVPRPMSSSLDQRVFLQSQTANNTNTTRLIDSLSADEKNSEDSRLPTSHTCFFSLHLPKYSSEKILRRRLLYAISNCVALDADYRLEMLSQ
jgi:E3 ubiquitin-protein ligase HERC1/E3 ubiquitin-protein ligase HERC2